MPDEGGRWPQRALLFDAGGIHAQRHQIQGEENRQVKAEDSHLPHWKTHTKYLNICKNLMNERQIQLLQKHFAPMYDKSNFSY